MVRLCLLTLATGVAAQLGAQAALAQAHGQGAHPLMPDQKLFFQCSFDLDGETRLIEAPVELASPMASVDLDQVIELPAPLASLRLTKYLGRAVLEQNAVTMPGGSAGPALLISVDGPTQSMQRWLAADDMKRNRLISFIATWRYMACAQEAERNELLEQFRDELTRDPQLMVSRIDGSDAVELPATAEQIHAFKDPSCSVRVKKFFPHFAIEDKSKPPTNLSDRRANPAVLVEIEHEGRLSERWLFAKFPEYHEEGAKPLPVKMQLDCPIAKKSSMPDFMLLSRKGAAHELWTRHGGKTSVQDISLNEKVEVAGSQYTFHIAQIVPSARLVEDYHPAQGKGSVSALQFATVGASGSKTTIWLELGKPRVLQTAQGPMTVVFGPRRSPNAGGHQ